MTAPTPAAPTFHPFPLLPAELRIKIWHLTIHPAPPSLCPFRPPTSDFWPAWSRAHLDNLRNFRYAPPLHGAAVVDFGTEKLPITSPLPQAVGVNHEARAAVLERAGPLVTTPARRRLMCTRTFDAERDVLFFRRKDLGGVAARLRQLHPDTDVAALLGARRVAVQEHWLDIDQSVVLRLLKQIRVVEVVGDVPVQLEECREIRLGEGATWRLGRDGWAKTSANPVSGGGEKDTWRAVRMDRLVQRLGGEGFLDLDAEIREVVVVTG